MFYYPGRVGLFYGFGRKRNWSYSDPLCVMGCYVACWSEGISLKCAFSHYRLYGVTVH